MKKEVLVFLSEDYGDWEGAYICSELNKPETGFAVKTMEIEKKPVKSMGGFTVIPDYGIPVAAICDACTFFADHGYLDHIGHTGNSLYYLKRYAENYKGVNILLKSRWFPGKGL